MAGDTLDILAQLSGSGWRDLDQIGATMGEQHAKISGEMQQIADREAGIASDALNTDAGKKLLDLLIFKTVLRPPTDAERGALTAEAFAIEKAKREGQNSIVFMLLGMLQHVPGKSTPGGEL